MRLAVYTDYEYCSDGSRRYGKRAFVVFLEAVGRQVEHLVLVGRMDPGPGESHYPLDERTELVGLPHYESLAHPWSVARSLSSAAETRSRSETSETLVDSSLREPRYLRSSSGPTTTTA